MRHVSQIKDLRSEIKAQSTKHQAQSSKT